MLGALLTVVGIIVVVSGATGGDLSIPHVLAKEQITLQFIIGGMLVLGVWVGALWVPKK